MNNLAETEQEREYRKNKNIIVWMIFLNIFPVYAGKIHKNFKDKKIYIYMYIYIYTCIYMYIIEYII